MRNECTLSAGCFDGHGSAPEQYRWHRLMRHVQCYSRSHWMPALSNNLLRIAPASARATGKQTTIINTPTKLAVLMAIVMPRYDTVHIAQWRRSRASLEATGCHHWASTCSDSNKLDTKLPRFCYLLRVVRRRGWRDWAGWLGNLIGVWHIKRKPRTWQMHGNIYMGWLI